jgi:S-methylmethionine-dependent homocysteine/selenocysteine methylase
MSKYRADLPQLSNDLFLTDSGLETSLIYHEGLDLPEFAAFDLLKDDEGKNTLRKYFQTHATLARENRVGFILESVTWRASSSWGEKIGYSNDDLNEMNRKAIELLAEIRHEFENDQTKMVISGCIGPREDGYDPKHLMSADEAEDYHFSQIETLSRTDADMVSAFTMSYVDEAIGLTRAALKANMPVVISFTVETDGRLPTGKTLKDAITEVDDATDSAPAYYMINCAHPSHFETEFDSNEPWLQRIHGLRANASCKSHAELDESVDIDDGDPVELALQYRSILEKCNHINVLGGCCGTDFRHIQEIATACIPKLQS